MVISIYRLAIQGGLYIFLAVIGDWWRQEMHSQGNKQSGRGGVNVYQLGGDWNILYFQNTEFFYDLSSKYSNNK